MRADLNTAGEALQRWLDAGSKSQEWLVDEINRRRGAAAIVQRVQRSNLWRWMTGRQRINIDEATLVQQITGGQIPATLWSVHRIQDRVPFHPLPTETIEAKTQKKHRLDQGRSRAEGVASAGRTKAVAPRKAKRTGTRRAA